MNDLEIRRRLREAVGDVDYPAALPGHVQARLEQPAPERHPWALGLVAALLAVAIVAALFAPRLLSQRSPVPGGPTGSAPAQVPDQDLAVAHLSALPTLVTPLNLAATSAGHRILLIGAYADPARTVLFFRTGNASDYVLPSVTDDQGLVNASSSGGPGVAGDYVYSLDGGPHPSTGGMANLKVTVFAIESHDLLSQSTTRGNWTFSFALKVQPSTPLKTVSSPFMLGSWRVYIEVAEATPSVIHLQAVIDGASPADIGSSTVTLVDASGSGVTQFASSAGVTASKAQLNPSSYLITRVNDQWERPFTAAAYRLRFQGGGGEKTIPLQVPALDLTATPAPVTGKPSATPTYVPINQGPFDWLKEFPIAQQSLVLKGLLNANVTSGRPSQCGAGTGPSGTIFAFGTYFQVGQAWYLLVFSTDPSVQSYAGPGTYPAQAWLYSVDANGTTQSLAAGTVQLTVSSDGNPDKGTVAGALSGQSQLTVSGGWTCVPGPALGPG